MFPLGGNTPIEQAPIYTNTSLEMGIVATPHSNETVLFIGDNLGYIKKVNKSVVQDRAVYFREKFSKG